MSPDVADVEPAADTRGRDWRTRARCREVDDGDLWFSTHKADRQEAAAICAVCPVRLECLAFAMSWRSYVHDETERPQGVWGGWLFPFVGSHKGAGRMVPRPVLPPPARHLVGV